MNFLIKDERKDIILMIDSEKITAISSAIKKIKIKYRDLEYVVPFLSDKNYEIDWSHLDVDTSKLNDDTMFDEISVLDENDYIIVKLTQNEIITHSPSIKYLTISPEETDELNFIDTFDLKFINNKIIFKDISSGTYFLKERKLK